MKVVEGQLERLKSMVEQFHSDKTLPAEIIRDYVEGMVKDQAVAPDVLRNTVQSHPDVSPTSGKLVKVTT